MELKNIAEIRNLSDEDYQIYVNNVVESIQNNSNYPWDIQSVSDILGTIRNFQIELITYPLIADYIQAYLIENALNINISAMNVTPLFADDCYKVLKWTIRREDTLTEKYTLLSENQLSSFIHNFHVFSEDGLLPEDLKPRAELEIEIQLAENRTDIINYLKHLDIISEEEANIIIPTPSNSLDINETTERFKSALWYERIKEQTVLLAGLGGIGSYVAFLLSRMHPSSLFLYDDDIVEVVNLAGQLYGKSYVGMPKVNAMGNMLVDMSNYTACYCIPERYTRDTQTCNIMICGFDNMSARKVFFDNWVNHVESKSEEERKNCLFIDGRLAAEEFQVLSIRGDDTHNIIKYAKEYLFSDEEADETLCSYKQTSYMANMIGSTIVNIFTNFVANSIEDNIRELPFLTTYDGSTMTFKITS